MFADGWPDLHQFKETHFHSVALRKPDEVHDFIMVDSAKDNGVHLDGEAHLLGPEDGFHHRVVMIAVCDGLESVFPQAVQTDIEMQAADFPKQVQLSAEQVAIAGKAEFCPGNGRE